MKQTKRTWLQVVALATMLVLFAGCSIGNLGFGINIDDGQLTATVRIGQEAVNKLIDRAGESVKVDDDDFLKELYGIDFVEPDTIRIDGEYQLADGSISRGVIDVEVQALAGLIKLRVTDVNVAGLTLNSPAISELNEELAREFARDVGRHGYSGDGIADVTVTNDALEVTVMASLSN
jgi:hypothetical protein